MTSRNLIRRPSLALAGFALLALGCGEDPVVEAPPPPPAPVVQAPPPAPEVESVASIMRRLGISDKIVLPEEKAPRNTQERVAILEFFDAFVRADASALRDRLTLLDAMELESLEKEGGFGSMCESIMEIELQSGTSPEGRKCVLALFVTDRPDQAQLWYYAVDPQPEFEAAPCAPHMMDKLHGEDWIAMWHDLMQADQALAMQPDEDLDVKPVDLDGSGGDDDGGFSAPGSSTPTFAPGGSPGGRRPTPPPRRPPGVLPPGGPGGPTPGG